MHSTRWFPRTRLHKLAGALLAALLLALPWLPCRNARAQSPGSGEVEAVDYRWNMLQDGAEAQLEEQLALDPGLSALLRGSGRLEPAALEARLLQAGASEAACTQTDRFGQIAIACTSRLPLQPGPDDQLLLPLPGQALLSLFTGLPADLAIGLQINSQGQVDVAGYFVSIPLGERGALENGGDYSQRFALVSLQRLKVYSTEARQPGDLQPIPASAPLQVGVVAEYAPNRTAWLAFATALGAALGAALHSFPSRRVQLQPAGQPSFLTRLLFMLVRALSGGLLVAAGFGVVGLAWKAAQLLDDIAGLEMALAELLFVLPIEIPPAVLLWKGWPVVLALAGTALTIVGGGLLLRQDWARWLLAAALLALAALLAPVWANVLLLPPWLPSQTTLLLAGGLLGLAGLLLPYRLLTHPAFRFDFLTRS